MADDENRRRRQDANAGNSDDDLDNVMMDVDDDDDDEFHLAEDVTGGVGGLIPAVLNSITGAITGVGPHRVLSQDRAIFPAPQFLFNNDRANRFSQNYRVMSARHLETRGHTNLESGGKVILPQDALAILSRNSSALMRPMMFRASNPSTGQSTHCGVLEFIAEEGVCYMPSWMMDSLGLVDRDPLQIERVELPTATFARVQPQSVDFLDISDPRAVLEASLRHFSCLTKGDMISITYNSRLYKMLLLETQPSDAVTIIDCDMELDFAAPVGYISPSNSDDGEEDDEETGGGGSKVFGGTGNRLNGKSVEGGGGGNGGKQGVKGSGKKTAPDEEWTIGKLQFKRKFKGKGQEQSGGGQQQKFTAFGGAGLSLRNTKKEGPQ